MAKISSVSAQNNYNVFVVNEDNSSEKMIELSKNSAYKVKKGQQLKIIDTLTNEEIDNFIAVKVDDNLEIILANEQTILLEDFYSYNDTELFFTTSENSVYTLSSSNDFEYELSDGNSLVYAQGDKSVLMSMTYNSESLYTQIQDVFTSDDSNLSAASEESPSDGLSTSEIVALGVLVVGGALVWNDLNDDSDNNSSSTTLTGYFVDSAVSGISYYINGEYAGTTGEDGSFTYEDGDTITFAIETSTGTTVTLGSIDASDINDDSNVLIQDIVGVDREDTDDATVIEIAQLLQTLDSDGDASNGITITDSTIDTYIDTSSDYDFTDSSTTAEDVIVDTEEDNIVSETEAEAHLNDSTNDVEENTIVSSFSGTIDEALDITNLVGEGTALTITGTATAEELAGLYAITEVSIIVTSATTIESDASDIKALISASVISGTEYAVTLTDTSAASIDDLVTINNATTGTITLNAETIAENYSDSASDLADAFDGITSLTGDITVTDAATIEELTTIDTATTGTLTYTSISDTAANAAADTTYITGSVDVNITDATTIAQLTTIDTATTGTVTADSIEDTSANLQANVGSGSDYVSGSTDVTLTDTTAATISYLITINNATTGTITLNSEANTADYSDTASDLAQAFDGITTLTGDLTVSDTGTVQASDLVTLIDATSGSITVSSATGVSGTQEDLEDVFDSLTFASNINITVTDGASISELGDLDGETTGTLTYTTIEDSSSNIISDISSPTYVSASINFEITDNYIDVDDLITINNYTSGNITLSSSANSANYSGSASDLAAAFDGITTLTGNITAYEYYDSVTAATLEELVTINGATTGTVYINYATRSEDFSGSASDLATALDGISNYYGDLTINDTTVATLEELITMNTYTDGSITLNNETIATDYEGTATDLVSAFSGTITTISGDLTISEGSTATLDELIAINEATTGSVVLSSETIATSYTGTVEDLMDAFDGTITEMTGNLTIKDSVSIANLTTINGYTTGTVTYYTIEDTYTNIDTNSAGYVLSTTNVIVTDSTTIANLTTLDASVGTVTADSISDEAANIITDIYNTTSYVTDTTDITLTDTSALSIYQLTTINDATDGTITLNSQTIAADYTDSASDLVDAFDGITSMTGALTVSGYATAAQINALDDVTSGIITANLYDTASNLTTLTDDNSNNVYTVTISGSASISELTTIDAISDSMSYSTVEDTATNLAANSGGYVTDYKSVIISGDTAATIDELIDINSYTNYTITLNDATIESDYSDSASDLADAFYGISSLEGDITVDDSSGTIYATDLSTIASATSGSVTVTNDVTISGTAYYLTSALVTKGVIASTANLTITDEASISQLTALDAITTGTITYEVEDTIDNALADDTYITGSVDVTITDEATIAQLESIDGETTGNITIYTIEDSVDNIVDNINTSTGTDYVSGDTNITLSEGTAATLEQLVTINDATSGSISLDDDTIATDYEGTVEDLLAAFNGTINTIDGDLTISEGSVATLAELITINEATDGEVILSTETSTTNYTGTISDLLDAFDGTVSSTSGSVDIDLTATDTATVDEVVSLNTDTDGIITLNAGVEIESESTFELSDLGNLDGITGLNSIDASSTTATNITITASELFAANDTTGDLSFSITGDEDDTLDLTGWTDNNDDTYSITGNFDGVDGDETYTITVSGDITVSV